jgi:hypothetical protein
LLAKSGQIVHGFAVGKSMPKGNVTQGHKARRLSRAIDLLCSGTPRGDAVRQLAQEFGIQERSAQPIVKRVIEEVLPQWYDLEEKKGLALQAIARLDAVIKEAWGDKNWTIVLRAIRHQCELMGLHSQQGTAEQAVDSVETAPIEQYNKIRAIYGMRRITAREYDRLRDGQRADTIQTPPPPGDSRLVH